MLTSLSSYNCKPHIDTAASATQQTTVLPDTTLWLTDSFCSIMLHGMLFRKNTKSAAMHAAESSCWALVCLRLSSSTASSITVDWKQITLFGISHAENLHFQPLKGTLELCRALVRMLLVLEQPFKFSWCAGGQAAR